MKSPIHKSTTKIAAIKIPHYDIFLTPQHPYYKTLYLLPFLSVVYRRYDSTINKGTITEYKILSSY